ncbi:hypothetical protein EDD99_0226 [Streptomyces sp. 846.5]|nr:hypothetical protein [Streptomyces sp. 846.5]TDU01847.1 hypothetical protein EDD99_0226 [Streptomyces sp. 846.5]
MAENRADDAPARPDSSVEPLALVEALHEASVLLYRATLPDSGGLRSPLDVYIVLGRLSAAIDPLDATLHQMHDFVTQAAEAAPAPDRDRDYPGARILADGLRAATEHARELATSLRRACGGMSLMPPPIGPEVADYLEDKMLMEEEE